MVETKRIKDLASILWSKYDNMKDFTDVFYKESCEEVYSILLKELYKLEA